MDKAEISLKGLQKKLKVKSKALRIEFATLTKREKDILAKTVKLTEEVGELANDILATLSLQRKEKLDEFQRTNMYEEFADVVLTVFMLANTLNVDMDRAVRDKLEKIISLSRTEKQDDK